MTKLHRLALTGVLAAPMAVAFAPGSAEAQSTTMTGPGGRTATGTTTRDAGNVNQTVTGPGGHSASRNVTRDPTTGAATATVTGPRGQTSTRTTTR